MYDTIRSVLVDAAVAVERRLAGHEVLVIKTLAIDGMEAAVLRSIGAAVVVKRVGGSEEQPNVRRAASCLCM